MKKADWYFDFLSPFAYLQNCQLDKLPSNLNLNRKLRVKVGAKKYISGMGGKDYIIEKNFLSSGIEIDFIDPELPSEYSQNYMNFGYLNDLSVLDLLFNCGDQWLDYF